jgi:hypothetical protein
VRQACAYLAVILVLGCGTKSEPKAPEKPVGCAPQECHGEGYCDAVLSNNERWIWNGKTCAKFYASGCGLVGQDCASLFLSEADCVATYATCGSVILPTRF